MPRFENILYYFELLRQPSMYLFLRHADEVNEEIYFVAKNNKKLLTDWCTLYRNRT